MDPYSFPARYFDGASAKRSDVVVLLADNMFQILDKDGAALESWAFEDVRLVRQSQGVLKKNNGLARVMPINPEDMIPIEARCLNLRKAQAMPGLWRKIGLWGGGALCGLVVLLFVILPAMANRLAPKIPLEQEVAFGQTVTRYAMSIMVAEDDEAPFCTDPAGQAALDVLADKLIAAAPLPYDEINLQVVRSDLVNAFAAPGGQVVVLSGLLDAANGPDELAGVLAHEFGHVAAHDPSRLALRAAGSAGLLGLAFGDFTGGTVLLALANQMLQASYTRDAEAAADVFALQALSGAGISPNGLADFFDSLAKDAGAASEFDQLLQSHPDLGTRANKARDAGTSDAGLAPALTDTQWRALQKICERPTE